MGTVRYYPLVLRGKTIGYLWGSVDDAEYGASTTMIVDALDADSRIAVVVFWSQRLERSSTEGLTPLEALEQWRGVLEDPVGGGIPQGADLGGAENAEQLGFWANPGYEEPPLPPELKEALEREPEAVPRYIGPEHVTKQLHKSYKTLTNQPVRYLPVRLGGQVIGYLWASVTNDAAYFVRRVKAQPESNFAEGWWIREFVNLHNQGLSPLEAIRARIGAPEDPKGGRIDPADEERTANSTDELKEIARQ